MATYRVHLERQTTATLELEVADGDDPYEAADDAIDQRLADALPFEAWAPPHVISIDGPVS